MSQNFDYIFSDPDLSINLEYSDNYPTLKLDILRCIQTPDKNQAISNLIDIIKKLKFKVDKENSYYQHRCNSLERRVSELNINISDLEFKNKDLDAQDFNLKSLMCDYFKLLEKNVNFNLRTTENIQLTKLKKSIKEKIGLTKL